MSTAPGNALQAVSVACVPVVLLGIWRRLPARSCYSAGIAAGNSKRWWARHGKFSCAVPCSILPLANTVCMHGLSKALQPHLQPCPGAAARLMPPLSCPWGSCRFVAWSSRQSGQQGPLGAGQASQDGLAGTAQQHQQQHSRAAHVGPGPNIQGVSLWWWPLLACIEVPPSIKGCE